MISKSKVTVRYAETDKMGIVHHSVYPIWYELARTDLSKQAGFPYSKMEEVGLMTPLVELNCKYYSPATYDDDLIVTARVSKLTPARVVFYYEVFKENEMDKPINTGYTVHAIVNKDMKPINTKKHFPEIYEAMKKMLEPDKTMATNNL